MFQRQGFSKLNYFLFTLQIKSSLLCKTIPFLSSSSKYYEQQKAYFGCHSLHGRLFYKRRPLQIPRRKPRNYRKKWLEMSPQKKGICEKVFVKTPRKPGSGLRKVAYVKLSTGKRVLAFIPGIGHNLNIHSVVLVQGGRVPDIPGCYYKCIRGVYDLLPVKGRHSSRSRYGVKLDSETRERKLRQRYDHQWLYTQQDIVSFNQLRWMTWKQPDGTPMLRSLKNNEPVPEPTTFNYKWKFIQWMKEHPKQ